MPGVAGGNGGPDPGRDTRGTDDVRAHRDHAGIEPRQARSGTDAAPEARQGLQGHSIAKLERIRRLGLESGFCREWQR
jgi:hypothetical protein